VEEHLHLIWLTCVWIIKKHINFVVFVHQNDVTCSLIDIVKLFVWSWIKAKVKGFPYDYYQWYTWTLMIMCDFIWRRLSHYFILVSMVLSSLIYNWHLYCVNLNTVCALIIGLYIYLLCILNNLSQSLVKKLIIIYCNQSYMLIYK